MTINDIIHGFRLNRQEEIAEIDGTALVFEHEKTGARLVYLSNDDDNKVFSIGFRTPSQNSTGVAHILEHSVLCGSAKYPLKEPFVELAKGSLNTFLNAMTYPDKTVYPVASTNAVDFKNLMDVYLDAVFHPRIYELPQIFKQEGWHYHLEKADDPITYNGVVYNEMKGVFSSPEQILEQGMSQTLFPDTIYGKESGGDPDAIPDLSYEAFCDFHQKYYHPSNAYIYLYGDGDVAEHLRYLDEEYLAAFEARPVDSTIAVQAPFTEMVEADFPYPVAEEEDTENKDYLSINYVLGTELSYEEAMAIDILCHILLDNNASPLKKRLLALGICKEVDYGYVASLRQPFLSIALKNTDRKHKELFLKTLTETLTELVAEGLDATAVEGAININEFALVEGEYGTTPRGLIYNLEMYDTWLYDGDPLSHLKYKDVLENIRAMAKDRGFEGLIQEKLLDNPHRAYVSIHPDQKMAGEKEAALAEKLAAYKESLSDAEVAALVADNEALNAYQNTEDSPEALATIPKLSLSDIDPQAREIVREEEDFAGQKLLYYPANTGGLVHLKLFFDTSVVAQEELPYLALLNKFLGDLGTSDYTYEELNQTIEVYTGGIATSLATFENPSDPAYATRLTVRGKAMVHNFPKLLKIMSSIMNRTHFEDQELMKDIIAEIRMNAENQFLMAGHVVSSGRLQSYYSQRSRYVDVISGISFYRFLAAIDEDFEGQYDSFVAGCRRVYEQVFNRENLIISLTCDPQDKGEILAGLEQVVGGFRSTQQERHTYHFDVAARNEGFMTAGNVQFVSKGYSFKEFGYEYSGAHLVLKSLLSMDYLWNKIRVVGGAYGAFFGINRSGDVMLTSYRDPHLRQSLVAYDGAPEYLKNLDLSQRELEKYIIGTISSKDVPLSAAMKADLWDTYYFSGISQADIQQERDEILGTKVETLRAAAPLLADVLAADYLCVLGNEGKIKEAAEVFNAVEYIK